jgi:hypothetical protein
LAALQEQSGVNIVARWKQAEIRPEATVTVDLHGVSVGAAVWAILQALKVNEKAHLVCEDNVLLVSWSDREVPWITRVYNVRDLTGWQPGMPSMALLRDHDLFLSMQGNHPRPPKPPAPSGIAPESPERYAVLPDHMIGTVEMMVSPGAWSDDGGGDAEIHIFQGLLVVRTRNEGMQARIASLLDTMHQRMEARK